MKGSQFYGHGNKYKKPGAPNMKDGSYSQSFEKDGAPLIGTIGKIAGKVMGGIKKAKGVVDKVKSIIPTGSKKEEDDSIVKLGAPMKENINPPKKKKKPVDPNINPKTGLYYRNPGGAEGNKPRGKKLIKKIRKQGPEKKNIAAPRG